MDHFFHLLLLLIIFIVDAIVTHPLIQGVSWCIFATDDLDGYYGIFVPVAVLDFNIKLDEFQHPSYDETRKPFPIHECHECSEICNHLHWQFIHAWLNHAAQTAR